MANLVVRWLVLDRWVPWVVLVFIGGSHGVRGRVYAVEDDEARDVEWPHWAGDHGGVLLSKERHVFLVGDGGTMACGAIASPVRHPSRLQGIDPGAPSNYNAP